MAKKKQKNKAVNRETVSIVEKHIKNIPILLSSGQRKEVRSALIRALQEHRIQLKATIVSKVKQLPTQTIHTQNNSAETYTHLDLVLETINNL